MWNRTGILGWIPKISEIVLAYFVWVWIWIFFCRITESYSDAGPKPKKFGGSVFQFGGPLGRPTVVRGEWRSRWLRLSLLEKGVHIGWKMPQVLKNGENSSKKHIWDIKKLKLGTSIVNVLCGKS